VPGVLLAAKLLLVVFPDGRLLAQGWWAVVGMAVCEAVLVALVFALEPAPLIVLRSVGNSFRVTKSVYDEVIQPLGRLGFALLIVSLVCGGVSLLIRVDKGSRVERQQIKWLAFFAAIMAVGFGIIDAGAWLFLVGIAAFNCFPIGVGIAVVRYRLLDIDVVINRTLVYGILTGILALVYFGGMAASEAVFRALTAQEEQPQIAVVASTLVIAALFTPLWRRIQLDTYSRRIVGWSMANNLKTELVLDALNMAIYNRRPQPGLIHHSDRGGQYTSVELGSRLKEAGLSPSTGSVADAYEDSMAKSFVSTLKRELIHRHSWPNRKTARTAIFEYIEGFYSTRRRHSALGHLSPSECEEARMRGGAVA
jgi:hypothetical protein